MAWTRAFLDLYLNRASKKHHDAKHGSAGESPKLYSLTPATGSHLGGTSVVIAGTNFTGATSVVFGATAAASFTVDSDKQITAVTPAHTAGTVVVVAGSPKGDATSGPMFTFT